MKRVFDVWTSVSSTVARLVLRMQLLDFLTKLFEITYHGASLLNTVTYLTTQRNPGKTDLFLLLFLIELRNFLLDQLYLTDLFGSFKFLLKTKCFTLVVRELVTK